MAQTETGAFRKCLKTNLADDATLKSLTPGGIYFGSAPKLRQNKKPVTPYGVIRIIRAPSVLGNAGRKVITTPLIRVLFFASDESAEESAKIDQAARKAWLILEELRYTVTDTVTEAGAAEDFEIRGFVCENDYDEVPDNNNGQLFAFKGGDYRGFGYYIGAC